jgi:hypothetical protein
MVKMEILCKTLNDTTVIFDTDNSHTSTHFADTPDLRQLVVEVLVARALVMDVEGFDVDMGRVVGVSSVVLVDDSDEVTYAKRSRRDDQGHVPFVASRNSEPSSAVSLHLIKTGETEYELASARIGS